MLQGAEGGRWPDADRTRQLLEGPQAAHLGARRGPRAPHSGDGQAESRPCDLPQAYANGPGRPSKAQEALRRQNGRAGGRASARGFVVARDRAAGGQPRLEASGQTEPPRGGRDRGLPSNGPRREAQALSPAGGTAGQRPQRCLGRSQHASRHKRAVVAGTRRGDRHAPLREASAGRRPLLRWRLDPIRGSAPRLRHLRLGPQSDRLPAHLGRAQHRGRQRCDTGEDRRGATSNRPSHRRRNRPPRRRARR